MQSSETELLKNAFEEFVKASDSLTSYYLVLEERISSLNKEINEKNKELEKAKESFYNILNSLPVGVVVQHGKSTIFTNKEAEKFGWTEFCESLDQAGSAMGEVRNGKGYFRWRKSSLTNGSSGKEVIVFEDVSEIQKMKERSERDEKLRAMGEMAARIAHEIKNPLGSMQLFLSMILRGKMGRKEREYVNSVIFGVNTIDRIINNLLSYTRPKTIALREAGISGIVKETLDFMSVSVGGKDVKIRFSSSYEDRMWFDPDLLKLALMNFISNAFEALSDKGSLDVAVRDEGKWVSIMFADDGVGMDEETRRNIFNPFFTTKDKGVGLGLFIAHNIVKAHDGYIEAESIEGKGSCFTIYLPKGRS
ncbi:MAG: ATP-binding protein [Syntrophorhabdales bacterium]|jgi:two-component system sensor histidine kinase FlrB